tara:strand:+ start:55 stop:723 length:669 start_codon:yes stop_codon:yes gene_type:complete
MILKDYSNFFNQDIIAFSTLKNNQLSPEKSLSESLRKYNINKVASCNQTHSNNVLFVDSKGAYNNSDGLITTIESNIFLQIQTADCVPIYMCDFEKGLIGLIHSGWKGTHNQIIKNAVNLFFERGSLDCNIQIFLGPSIQECCYEIKNDVAIFFADKYLTLKEEKIYLNLQSKIIDDLLNLNIHAENIKKIQDCTFHNNNFYSYRRDKNSGRIYSILGFINE